MDPDKVLFNIFFIGAPDAGKSKLIQTCLYREASPSYVANICAFVSSYEPPIHCCGFKYSSGFCVVKGFLKASDDKDTSEDERRDLVAAKEIWKEERIACNSWEELVELHKGLTNEAPEYLIWEAPFPGLKSSNMVVWDGPSRLADKQSHLNDVCSNKVVNFLADVLVFVPPGPLGENSIKTFLTDLEEITNVGSFKNDFEKINPESAQSLASSLLRLYDICDIAPRDPTHISFGLFFPTIKQKKLDQLNKKANRGNGGQYWSKGTGYGTADDDHVDTTWSHEECAARQTQISKHLEKIVHWCLVTLNAGDEFSPFFWSIMKASPLLPFIEAHLRNDTICEMVQYFNLYRSILKLIISLSKHENILPELYGVENPHGSVFGLLKNLRTFTAIASDSSLSSALQSKSVKEEQELLLASEIEHTFETVSQNIEKWQQKMNHTAQTTRVLAPPNQEIAYTESLETLQFGAYNMKEHSPSYVHHYSSQIAQDAVSNPDKIRRLRREVRAKLPLHPESSVFLKVDSNRIDVMKAMITGPKDTPYSNGCFLFDIFCPSGYPKCPPLVNLHTTGKGAVRFNPNLYNCGKVCLSLLGTWQGGATETWNENISSLYQVLVSIQSLIFVDEPYFNEPGYERTINSTQGRQASEEYNQVIRIATAQWAILDVLQHAPHGFEEIVKLHFTLRREDVMADLSKWLALATKHGGASRVTTLKNLITQIHQELQRLIPEKPLAIPSVDFV